MKKYFALLAMATLASTAYGETETNDRKWELSLGGGVMTELSPIRV